MKRTAKLFVCASCLLLLCLSGCTANKEMAQPKLLDSMAALDRFYIPALLFTDLQRQRESEIAVARLKGVWADFYEHFRGLEMKYGLDITDTLWQEDFETVNGLIATAEVLVREERLAEASLKLEKVRVIFRDLRHRNGLEYFLDGMTNFDRAMENIFVFIRGKDRLSDKQMEDLRDLFRKAQGSWSRLSRTKIDGRIYGFDDEKVKAVKKKVQNQERALAGFATALYSRDTNRIFQSAQDLKPNFVVLYKAFGDFQPIFDQVVRERREAEAEAQARARASAEAAVRVSAEAKVYN